MLIIKYVCYGNGKLLQFDCFYCCVILVTMCFLFRMWILKMGWWVGLGRLMFRRFADVFIAVVKKNTGYRIFVESVLTESVNPVALCVALCLWLFFLT